MIIVRNTFTAKPGQAGKLAAQLKEMVAVGGLKNARVLTDVVTNFNTVVMEHEIESLSEMEEMAARYASNPELRAVAEGYTDRWSTGKRELFKVV